MSTLAIASLLLAGALAGTSDLSLSGELLRAEGTPAAPVMLQEADASSERWTFSIKPYLWASGVDADVSVGNLADVTFEKDASDVISDLDFGLMLGLEARAPDESWGLIVDSIYLDLAGDTGPLEWDFEMLELEGDLAWRVGKHVDLLAGARYIGVDAAASTSPGNKQSGDKDFVDPVVGARGTWPFAERFGFSARGDVGGFGVGSELSWQLAGLFRWHATQGLDVGLGWRHMEFDLEEGNLDLEVALDGPIVGLDFHF